MIFIGCSNEDYEALNSDPNNPTDVDAGHYLCQLLNHCSILRKLMLILIIHVYSLNIGQKLYTDEANYEMINRGIPKIIGIHIRMYYLIYKMPKLELQVIT